MIALLSDKLHSAEYWVADVMIPACVALLLGALATLLFRLRPSWLWVDVAVGAHFSVCLAASIAAYQSDFLAIFGERVHASFPASWEGIMRVVDFSPNLLSALVPIVCVRMADLRLHPVAQKIVKLLQASVVAAATGATVYIFAVEGWNQPSFQIASFAQILGADIGFAGALLISGLSWVIGASLRSIALLRVEVPQAFRSANDWIMSLQGWVLSKI
jgi:hypothetical protein